MNVLFWILAGIGIYGCLALLVLALGKAAARADQEWDTLACRNCNGEGRVEMFVDAYYSQLDFVKCWVCDGTGRADQEWDELIDEERQ